MEENYKVYCHLNKINGKRYIGITSLKRINDRWHSDGSGYRNQMFYKAIQKYGWDNFEHIILNENLTQEKAFELEIYYIDLYKSNNPDYGYNLSSGGEISSKGALNNGLSIKVYCYDAETGVFLNEYPSTMEAERQTGINNSLICSCCKGKNLFTKEYRWSYDKLEYLPPLDKKEFKRNIVLSSCGKKVYKYSTYDGRFISEYESYINAAEELSKIINKNIVSIQKCISKSIINKTYQSYGYLWFDSYQGEFVNVPQNIKRLIKNIFKYSIDTNKLIGCYKTMTEAADNNKNNLKYLSKMFKDNKNICLGFSWDIEYYD